MKAIMVYGDNVHAATGALNIRFHFIDNALVFTMFLNLCNMILFHNPK